MCNKFNNYMFFSIVGYMFFGCSPPFYILLNLLLSNTLFNRLYQCLLLELLGYNILLYYSRFPSIFIYLWYKVYNAAHYNSCLECLDIGTSCISHTLSRKTLKILKDHIYFKSITTYS